MIAAMAFSFRYYVRSYRYVAPLLIYGFFVFFIYYVVPNPVMPSYSFTSALLFLISTWLGFGFIDLEDDTQQAISVLHVGSVNKYYLAKMLVLLAIVIGLSAFTTVYPILLDKFVRQPTGIEAFVALMSHVLLAWLGITISFLFTNKLIRALSHAILGLFLVVAFAMSGAGIENALPDLLRVLIWLIPPVFRVMDSLNNYETASFGEVSIALLSTLLYSLIIAWIFLRMMKRKLF
jgi:hypothetical protein